MELVPSHDRFFLHTETATVPQQIMGVAILDASGLPGGRLRTEDVAEAMRTRLGGVRRLHQRLARDRAGRIAWVDGSTDIGARVRRADLPPPAGPAELVGFVEELAARHLDRSEPLWEAHVVEDMPDGLAAVALKVHHVLADGEMLLRLATALMSAEPDPAAGGPVRLERTTGPGTGDARRALAAGARRAAAIGAGLVELARAGPAPPSPLNAPVGSARRFAVVEVPSRLIGEVRSAFRVTVNDVALAALGEGLSELLRDREGTPRGAALRTMIPVSVAGRHGPKAGNRTGTLAIDLPVGPMPVDLRLASIRSATRRLKRSHQAEASAFVLDALRFVSPASVQRSVARWMYRGKWLNLVATYVPGPQRARYLLGARILGVYPVMPLVEGVGLTAAVTRWVGTTTFGLTADPAIVPDLDRVVAGVERSLRDLARATTA